MFCVSSRILKNREDPDAIPKTSPLTQKLMVTEANKKENIHSIEGAIPSHHSAATNRGYSRKHDGGFYTC